MSHSSISVREGSSLYYSLLWTDSAEADRLVQRLELIHALVTTLDDVQEPQVAEKKIHWWHEELQRLHDGCARHPAAIQNQEALKGREAAQAACLDIISAVSTERYTPFKTNEASEANMTNGFRARLALLGHALSNNTADLDSGTHPDLAALAFAHHEQLTRLPNLIHRGLPVFSDEMYNAFNIRPIDLARHVRTADASADTPIDNTNTNTVSPMSPGLKSIPVVVETQASDKVPARQRLLSHAIEHSQSLFQQALTSDAVIQRYRQPSMLPLWRLLVLRKHQLDLWSKRHPDLLRERMTLTPVSKFFRAWLNRR